MHRQFLLQISDLFLQLLQQPHWILLHIHHWRISDFHHARAKLKSRDAFLQVISFRPHISNHHSLAVSPNAVLQQIGQLALSVRYVVPPLVAHRDDHLLQE